MAKGIAGGMPLSAITGRADLLDAVHPGGLGGTYGGNPVACAAALASIGTMEQYDLNGRAKPHRGARPGRLRELAELEVSVVGDIRGRGAMLAIELVQAGSKEPNPELTKAVAAACLKEGVIILTCGTYGNVIRLLPPLVISDELLHGRPRGAGRSHQGARVKPDAPPARLAKTRDPHQGPTHWDSALMPDPGIREPTEEPRTDRPRLFCLSAPRPPVRHIDDTLAGCGRIGVARRNYCWVSSSLPPAPEVSFSSD